MTSIATGNLLAQTNDVVIIYSLLEELVHRQGLYIALAGRDEVSLSPILSYLAANLTDPRFVSFLIDICHSLFGKDASLGFFL